jgi:hypothetical protein
MVYTRSYSGRGFTEAGLTLRDFAGGFLGECPSGLFASGGLIPGWGFAFGEEAAAFLVLAPDFGIDGGGDETTCAVGEFAVA